MKKQFTEQQIACVLKQAATGTGTGIQAVIRKMPSQQRHFIIGKNVSVV